MAKPPRDDARDRTRSVDEEIATPDLSDTPPPVGPATAGPIVVEQQPDAGQPIAATETPSEGEVALEQEVRETRASPRR